MSQPDAVLSIERLDHLVLTVADIEATVAFYARVLGMRRVDFGAGRVALGFGRQKINLHRAGHEFEPRSRHPTPGSGDLCPGHSDVGDARRSAVPASHPMSP